MKTNFREYLDELIETHMATGFMNYGLVKYLKTALEDETLIGRKELLLFAYMIGANADEADNLLQLVGHQSLYVKQREDAIWRFVLNHRLDSSSIIDEIFPQNVDEI